MKTLVLCIVVALPILAMAEIRVGSSRDDVIKELGAPVGEMVVKGVTIMTYDGGVLELRNGTVVRMDEDFQRRRIQRQQELAFAAEQQAKGLMLYDGAWVTKAEADSLAAAKAEAIAAKKAKEAEHQKQLKALGPQGAGPNRSYDAIADIRQEGAEIDIAGLAVPGRITIVDFYADWCGPCRALTPKLEELVLADADLRLRKVDIVDWERPVVAQHGITSIPHVRVLDRKGKLVGQPTSDIYWVREFVKRAK